MVAKILKFSRLFLRNKTKTLFFVLRAPQNQDIGLKDYTTAREINDLKKAYLDLRLCFLDL